MKIFTLYFIMTFLVLYDKKFNMAPRTVARNISNLKNKDLLRRVGSNKSGYWEVY